MRNRQLGAARFDYRIEVPWLGRPVKITRVCEQLDVELYWHLLVERTGNEAPRAVRGVLAVFHPDTLLDGELAAGVAPDRHAAVELEALDVEVAEGIDRAAGPAIGEQVKVAAAAHERGVRFGEHQMAAERRVHRRHQQAVITPRERAGDRTRCIATQTIREPPFAALGLREIAADFPAEANQFWKF